MIQIVALTEESSSQDLLFFPRILHVSINMYFKTLGNSHLPTLQVILSILQGTFITTICRLILSLAAPRLCRQPFRSFASTSTQAHNHYASMEESLSPVSCSSVQDRPHPLLRSPPLQGPSHVTSLSRPRQDPPQREDGKGVLPEPSWNSERDQGPRGGCESCRRRFSGFSEKTRRCNLGRQDTWRMANGAKRRILDDGRAGVYGA